MDDEDEAWSDDDVPRGSGGTAVTPHHAWLCAAPEKFGELAALSCPVCSAPLRIKHRNADKRSFLGCSAFPQCTFATDDPCIAPADQTFVGFRRGADGWWDAFRLWRLTSFGEPVAVVTETNATDGSPRFSTQLLNDDLRDKLDQPCNVSDLYRMVVSEFIALEDGWDARVDPDSPTVADMRDRVGARRGRWRVGSYQARALAQLQAFAREADAAHQAFALGAGVTAASALHTTHLKVPTHATTHDPQEREPSMTTETPVRRRPTTDTSTATEDAAPSAPAGRRARRTLLEQATRAGRAVGAGAEMAVLDQASGAMIDLARSFVPEGQHPLLEMLLTDEDGRAAVQGVMALVLLLGSENAPDLVPEGAADAVGELAERTLEVASYKLLTRRGDAIRPQLMKIVELAKRSRAMRSGRALSDGADRENDFAAAPERTERVR